MRNIELFDEYAARVLAELYAEFPTKTYLDACALSGHEGSDVYGRVVNKNGDPSKEFEIAYSTLQWLWETGYIRADGLDNRGLTQSVLSPMGLAVLKSTPSSLTVEETTGDKLARLVKNGSMSAATDLIKSTIVASANLAVTTISGAPS